MIDYINGYNSFDYSRNYLNNYAPMLGNPMYMQYGQNSYMQTPALFNYQAQDNSSFGNSQAPIVNMNSEEKKKGNNTLLILGGLTIAALGIIFHKNIAKALGFGKEVAKDSKGLVDNVAKNSEKALDDVSKAGEKAVNSTETVAVKEKITNTKTKNNDGISVLKEEHQAHSSLKNEAKPLDNTLMLWDDFGKGQKAEASSIGYSVVSKENYSDLDLSKIRVQAAPKDFAPHNYQPQDIPSINLTTRTVNIDYRSFEMVDGQTARTAVRKHKEPFDYLKMKERPSDLGTVLVAGKNAQGKRVVWLQAKAGRDDRVRRSIGTSYVFDAPSGEQFTKVQLDLMKGIFGKSQEVLVQEAPLSRSVKVIESLDFLYKDSPQPQIKIDQETLLREINHYAQGQTISSELAEKLKKVDSLKNGEYIRLWG